MFMCPLLIVELKIIFDSFQYREIQLLFYYFSFDDSIRLKRLIFVYQLIDLLDLLGLQIIKLIFLL